MLMRDHPIPVKFAEANGRAPPHINLPSVRRHRVIMAEAVGEGNIFARSDVQSPNLVTDRALE
jgi:hypothetical protein